MTSDDIIDDIIVDPGTRFNAYDDLFGIRKAEDESLQSLINRVEDAMKQIKDLQPDGFTMDLLDEELASMTLIQAMPSEEYSSFTSSLLLKNKLDKAAVHQVFITEDIQRCRHTGDVLSFSSTLAASSNASRGMKSAVSCTWCGRNGHEESKYWRKDKDRLKAQEDTQNAPSRSQKCRNHANVAQDASEDSSPSPSKNASKVTEFAGNASTSFPPTSPSSSTPLQLDADFYWIADTGATSHMTSHHHWFKDYTVRIALDSP
ncbi:hypothetical protein NP233_g11047 [Leucocoprinus birnbaumii]|uniref:Uncharacterized protein n=1 Tax=Leucocoprinus birnbaumii TaxID=56174 RepID=A0AAD5YRB3_9AGAR|nr:hypothetical protein NP233_g11047 [Leucocoprinus birnbaumii]